MSDPLICPKCDSLVVNIFCVKCGYNVGNAYIHHNKKQKNIETESLEGYSIQNSETIFASHKYSMIIVATAVSFVSTLYFYTLGIQKPVYISPVSIEENSMIKNVIIEETEKVPPGESETIELDIRTEFPELDISSSIMYDFVPPKNQVIIHIADLNTYRKDFLGDSKYDNVIKDFDLSEGDITNSLYPDFVITFPEDNFNEFGFIAIVKNKELIEKKLINYNKKFSGGTRESLKAAVSLKSGFLYNKLVQIEKNNRKIYFLIIANSKDYLDELKEASEGNLKNINNDALFADIKLKLDKQAHSFIYIKDKENIWPKIVTRIFEVYKNNEILDKLTKARSKGLLIYSKDGKVYLQTQD